MDNLMNNLDLLRQREVIRPIDLELCHFLREQHPDISQSVLLAVSLVSYLYRQGDVCLPLEEYAAQAVFDQPDNDESIKTPPLNTWREELKESPAVGAPGDFKPMILDGSDRLYMHKLWHYEYTLAEELINRSNRQVKDIDVDLLRDGLDRMFEVSSQEVDWQLVAAATSVCNRLSIISGGPGTGKTSTVVRILALILEQSKQKGESLDIALAAPTGKAAARLKDSILSAKENLDIDKEIQAAIPGKAKTLHQLLGARRYSSQFKHNADNPVPYDLVIVDEASMVDQALMSKLLEALLDDTRLILLGDKDQLASVEAGSVLGNICDVDRNYYSVENIEWLKQLSLNIPEEAVLEQPKPLTDNITLLTKSYRFEANSGISQLSQSINDGDAEQAISVLESAQFKNIDLKKNSSSSDLEDIFEEILPSYFRNILKAESPQDSLDAYNLFRILSAHRKGPWGIDYLNNLVEKFLQDKGLIPKHAQWYPGKPVIINVNDYILELFNGDTGLCLADERGNLKVYFRKEGSVRAIAPNRLPEHNRAYALTVHKSQGSEFEEVFLVLPNILSKVVSRELIYTAITRARKAITIIGKERILKKGIEQRLHRSSGLSDYLWS